MLPDIQAITLLNSWVVNLNWNIVNKDVKAIFIPIPINNSLDEFIPFFHANMYIKNAPNMAPLKATIGIVKIVKLLTPSYTFPFIMYI